VLLGAEAAPVLEHALELLAFPGLLVEHYGNIPGFDGSSAGSSYSTTIFQTDGLSAANAAASA
jgi:hypothetical protein